MIRRIKYDADGRMVEHTLDNVPQPIPEILKKSSAQPPSMPYANTVIGTSSKIYQPGSIFSLVIKKITGSSSITCGRCSSRVRQMNQWGWLKCWTNRNIISGWLIEEAKSRGHEIGENEVMDLIKAAFRELRSKKRLTPGRS